MSVPMTLTLKGGYHVVVYAYTVSSTYRHFISFPPPPPPMPSQNFNETGSAGSLNGSEDILRFSTEIAFYLGNGTR